MRVNRHLGLAAVATAAMVTAAACGGGGGGGGSAKSSGTISVIMASYSSKSPPYWKDLVSRFEKANPKIHVNLRVIDWDTLLQQVPTMIQTKSYPDVLNFNAYSTFASAGLLRPAKQVLSPQVESDFVPSFLSSDSLHGTQYGIPWIASVRALGYNKQAFAKAGIKSPPATWAEFVTDAKKAQQAGYTGYCLPLGSEESQAEWSLWMWSNGGGWVTPSGKWSINSAKNLQAMNFLRTLANTDKVTEPNPGKTQRTAGCWASFSEGKVAMTEIMPLGTFQTSFMSKSKVKWASSPWPRASMSVPEFTLGVQDVLMAFNRPGNTLMVKKFLDFVYQKSNYLKFIQNEGFLPTTKSADQALASNPVAGEGIKLLPKANFYPVTNPGWNKVQSAVQSQLGTAVEPGTSPGQVLNSLQQIAQSSG
ncbi:MAG: extracellular solute-binding protein [Actinobacteria bacterium]|nr:extracellular solute-binding protein [Actinomycetota bacterium]